MRKTIGLLVIIGLLVAAYFLNPSYSKHMEKIGVPGIIGKELDKPGDLSVIAGTMIKYNNYYLFSTTTNELTNQRLTFGLFGVVFR